MAGVRESGEVVADAGRDAAAGAAGLGRAFRLLILLPALALPVMQQALALSGGSLVLAYICLAAFAFVAWHAGIGREFAGRARRRAERLNALEDAGPSRRESLGAPAATDPGRGSDGDDRATEWRPAPRELG